MALHGWSFSLGAAMIDFRNPYTPGADAMPKFLAGRDDILESASLQLKALAATIRAARLFCTALGASAKRYCLTQSNR